MPYKNSLSNILLVDDSRADVDLIERAIHNKDAKVQLSVAQDGQEALACLKEWEQGSPSPLIVLLDLKLPKVSGLDVLRTLKSHPRYKILPVIVLTSSTDPHEMLQAYQLGANSFIMKATDYNEFASSVVLMLHYWYELNIYPE